jgi:hypothetical protein
MDEGETMKVVEEGHIYQLNWLDGNPPIEHWNSDWDNLNDTLVFVKREGDKYPGNIGHHPGTNIQEVLRALIHRVKYLDNQIPDYRNELVIENLRDCIQQLEERAADRHRRKLYTISDDFENPIEMLPTCKKCGHIGCKGECHETR